MVKELGRGLIRFSGAAAGSRSKTQIPFGKDHKKRAAKLGGKGEGKEAKGGKLLVVPAGSLDGVGEVGGEAGGEKDEGSGAAVAREEKCGEGGAEEELELEGFA